MLGSIVRGVPLLAVLHGWPQQWVASPPTAGVERQDTHGGGTRRAIRLASVAGAWHDLVRLDWLPCMGICVGLGG